jgi:hypothetical protein
MNRRFAAWWALATAAISAVVGFFAYNAGLATHVANGGPHTVYPGYYGFGFGFFPLFGLFWIFLIGFLLFRLFARPWRGPWGGYGGGGYWHQHPHDPTAGTSGQGMNQPGGGPTQQSVSA